jgi:hypothetical protein
LLLSLFFGLATQAAALISPPLPLAGAAASRRFDAPPTTSNGLNVVSERISDCLEDEDRALINVQSGNAKAKAMESKGYGYLESLHD